MKRIIYIIAAMLTIASCSVNDLNVLEKTYAEEVLSTQGNTLFHATLEGSETKTCLGVEDDGEYPVYWSDGDKIKVFTTECKYGEGREFTLVSGAGTANAVFSGNLNAEDEGCVYYALYPYSSTASFIDNNGLTFYFPKEQKYVPNSFDNNLNPAVAVTSTDQLHFVNLCGILKLSATGDVKINKIVLHAAHTASNKQPIDDPCLWGTAKFNTDLNSLEFQHYPEVSETRKQHSWGPDGDQSYLNMVFDSPVELQAAEATDFFFVLPTRTLSCGFDVTFYDETGKEVFYKKTTADNTIGRSKLRRMPAVDIRGEEFEDLSAKGTANSYMVKPDGNNYRFYALRKGNSAEAIEGADSAIVLFRTHNDQNFITDSAVVRNVRYDRETGYISFNTEKPTPVYSAEELLKPEEERVPERYESHPGNATIALLDASHNVLWSWHIWSSDYDPDRKDQKATLAFRNGTGAVLMDRNLGALAPDQYGFFYSWGRKDPFVAHTDLNNDPDFVYLYNTYPYPVHNRNTDTREYDRYEYSIQNPTTYVPGGFDSHLMIWDSEKTKTDPCPPGWKVADLEAFLYSDAVYDRSNGQFNYYSGENEYYSIGNATAHYTFPDYHGQGYYTNYFGRGLYAPAVMNNSEVQYYYSHYLRQVRCQREDSGMTEEEMTVDLSANGTSNCYIVNKPGSYKFKADVKGNTDETVGCPAFVKVDWQSKTEEGRSPVRYEEHAGDYAIYSDGYVYFRTSYIWNEGSAVISVADINGETLWSWHIWFTTYDPEVSNIQVEGSDGEGMRTMMSRNLGAVDSETTSAGIRGMMYQWGRKDPFIGASACNSNVPGQGGAYVSVPTSGSVGTVRYSIQNPTTIIKGIATEAVTDWNYDHDNTLWGDEKTEYDPCPPGWQVPPAIEWADNHTISGSFTYNCGLTMDGNLYPASGFRFYGSSNLEQVGMSGGYWYATAHDDGTAHSFFFNSSSIMITSHVDNKAQCFPVRCMRITQ